jgi:ribosomal 30S subunit maturation factor RimM
VWKNSRHSAGRVGERERERKRERERERERDPEPASGSSTPQHLTIFLSNDLVVCRAAYAAVVVVEEK